MTPHFSGQTSPQTKANTINYPCTLAWLWRWLRPTLRKVIHKQLPLSGQYSSALTDSLLLIFGVPILFPQVCFWFQSCPSTPFHRSSRLYLQRSRWQTYRESLASIDDGKDLLVIFNLEFRGNPSEGRVVGTDVTWESNSYQLSFNCLGCFSNKTATSCDDGRARGIALFLF